MALHLAINFQRIDPSKGGAETYVADLCRQLARRGHRVDLYANSWVTGALPDEVRIHPVPTSGTTRAARIWNFAKNSADALSRTTHDCSVGFINTWAHDVIIPQGGVHAGSLECNARRFHPVWKRQLYLASKRWNPRHNLYRRIEERQYNPESGAKVVVAVGAMVREHLERFHGVPEARIRVIPNAIDADRLRVDDRTTGRERYREEFGLAGDDLACLFVGHNFRLKGLPDLLAALRLRLDQEPSARSIHLIVCGGGRLAPIRQLVARLGLESTVRLVGFAPDIRVAFHAADFFCLPTYYDPCSLVVFEALACGLPVITTAYNGAGDVMTQGQEGYVVPSPHDHAALAKALNEMVHDEARRAMSANASRLGCEQSFDQHVTRLEAVFREVTEWKQSGAEEGTPCKPSFWRAAKGHASDRSRMSFPSH